MSSQWSPPEPRSTIFVWNNMKNHYTITIFAENKPGVLYRMADLFLRRKINIDSMTVSEIKEKGLSRFTILVHSEKDLTEKVVKQLYKIIEVTKVIESEETDLIVKEVALLKVNAGNLEKRKEIEHLVHLADGKIIAVKSNSLVIEKTGTEEEIDSLYELLRPFGIKEFVRSGRIVVFKD